MKNKETTAKDHSLIKEVAKLLLKGVISKSNSPADNSLELKTRQQEPFTAYSEEEEILIKKLIEEMKLQLEAEEEMKQIKLAQLDRFIRDDEEAKRLILEISKLANIINKDNVQRNSSSFEEVEEFKVDHLLTSMTSSLESNGALTATLSNALEYVRSAHKETGGSREEFRDLLREKSDVLKKESIELEEKGELTEEEISKLKDIKDATTTLKAGAANIDVFRDILNPESRILKKTTGAVDKPEKALLTTHHNRTDLLEEIIKLNQKISKGKTEGGDGEEQENEVDVSPNLSPSKIREALEKEELEREKKESQAIEKQQTSEALDEMSDSLRMKDLVKDFKSNPAFKEMAKNGVENVDSRGEIKSGAEKQGKKQKDNQIHQ